jgi:hypothetical protein
MNVFLRTSTGNGLEASGRMPHLFAVPDPATAARVPPTRRPQRGAFLGGAGR